MARIIIMVCCLLFCSVGTEAVTQAEFTHEGLEAVPTSLRSALVERLSQYVEYDRTRNFEAQYELFSEVALQAYDQRTQKAYVESRRNSYPILLVFKPLMSGYDAGPAICRIAGEAELQWKDKRTTEKLYLEANLKNGIWYLSRMGGRLEDFSGNEPVTTTMPVLTNKPVPKKLQKRKKHFWSSGF